MHIREMIGTHPQLHGGLGDAVLRAIEACYDCAQTCIACADACLAESMVTELRQCIRLNLDCADICMATGAIASRQTGDNVEILRDLIDVCAEACRTCAAECRLHAQMHEHCRICAEACESCEQACREALGRVH